jgi:RecA/RadA recombinase
METLKSVKEQSKIFCQSKMSGTLNKIKAFLDDKDNKKFHYNDYEELDYKISTGSLNLDLALGGGFPAGVHRFTGVNEGGKTSCALAVAKRFQDRFGEKALVVYIKSEGRLTKEMVTRAGIDPSEERFFKFDCNVFEKVFELIRLLVKENEEDKKYLFIVDSVDALCRQNDYEKPFEDSEQVAGGALITSVFLKKMVLPIIKLNHMMILTSQVRVEVATNPYAARGGPKTKQAGGNAIKHYANFILEFQERYNSDIIFEKPSAAKLEDKGSPIGHQCKIIFRKSINEKTGTSIRYPIRYGRTNGRSVWREREVLDMAYLWGFLEKKGAWISLDKEIVEKCEKAKIEFIEKIQGEPKLIDYLETHEPFCNLLLDLIKQEVDSLK